MTVLAVIPARGGSKGLPRKNIQPLAGKPLIGWTAEAARASGAFARLVVSTDDDEIAAVAVRHGADAPFRRPADLSGDIVGAAPVIRHALQTMEALDGVRYEALAYLQPTSPFRRPETIAAAVGRFRSVQPDTLVSLVRVPHNMTPDAQMRIDNGWAVPREDGGGPLRRQEKPASYARNGPAILILSRAQALSGTLYGPRTLAFEMDRLSSFDIDDAEDLRWAEALAPLATW